MSDGAKIKKIIYGKGTRRSFIPSNAAMMVSAEFSSALGYGFSLLASDAQRKAMAAASSSMRQQRLARRKRKLFRSDQEEKSVDIVESTLRVQMETETNKDQDCCSTQLVPDRGENNSNNSNKRRNHRRRQRHRTDIKDKDKTGEIPVEDITSGPRATNQELTMALTAPPIQSSIFELVKENNAEVIAWRDTCLFFRGLSSNCFSILKNTASVRHIKRRPSKCSLKGNSTISKENSIVLNSNKCDKIICESIGILNQHEADVARLDALQDNEVAHKRKARCRITKYSLLDKTLVTRLFKKRQ